MATRGAQRHGGLRSTNVHARSLAPTRHDVRSVKPRPLPLHLFLLAATLLPALPSQSPAAVAANLTAPAVQDSSDFTLSLRAGDGRTTRVAITLQRGGDDTFLLTARSDWATFTLWRDAQRTLLLLPEHKVGFVGEGAVDTAQGLAPRGLLARLCKSRVVGVGLLRTALLAKLGGATAADGSVAVDKAIQARADGEALVLTSSAPRGFTEDLRRIELRLADSDADPAPPATDGLQLQTLSRQDLEHLVLAGLRRAVEIYVPGMQPPEDLRPRTVDHGELRLVDGQRVVLLNGTAEQIGKAHGELLGAEVQRTLDSCLYLIGLIETVHEGKWFPDQLAAAWARLSPHIPDRHRREIDAIADAVPGLSRRELQLANVFPEYFHCSGFAVFGKATENGVLYHGRVLDYMTMIGLQQAAATFVIAPDQGYAFANVGFAGFVGSVTGMNERGISLGEMGGRGRGAWDGVPMATLMRRALEECSTLGDVQRLWQESPRTCEYYYVFADGKSRSAVGVAATPEQVQFVQPGETHPLLKPGIADTVILSAGSRLDLLHQRIQQAYGKIDAAAALHLMDRPVAMQSNLHDALMVPEQGVVYVAVASQTEPAATQPYARVDLRPLWGELAQGQPAHRYFAHDSLPALQEIRPDARQMLQGLWYDAQPFAVEVTAQPKGAESDCQDVVHFPSPRSGEGFDPHPAVLEWYHARGQHRAADAPAVLVLHILDGRMRVARSIARVLSSQGIHAFVLHMPGYGDRSEGHRRPPTVTQWLLQSRQAVDDARRARDAIAALPGIDPAHISIQGTSLGGFVGAGAAALDGAFDNTFLFLAGGDLPALFRDGELDIGKLRDQLRREGMSDADRDRQLAAIDPMRIAHRLDPQRTWLYSGRADNVVPPANAEALAQAAGLDAEHHVWLDATHYSGILMLPGILRQMVARIEARSR